MAAMIKLFLKGVEQEISSWNLWKSPKGNCCLRGRKEFLVFEMTVEG